MSVRAGSKGEAQPELPWSDGEGRSSFNVSATWLNSVLARGSDGGHDGVTYGMARRGLSDVKAVRLQRHGWWLLRVKSFCGPSLLLSLGWMPFLLPSTGAIEPLPAGPAQMPPTPHPQTLPSLPA